VLVPRSLPVPLLSIIRSDNGFVLGVWRSSRVKLSSESLVSNVMLLVVLCASVPSSPEVTDVPSLFLSPPRVAAGEKEMESIRSTSMMLPLSRFLPSAVLFS